MGAGKSSVGRRLAERLGCEFVDLDVYIEERSGKSIAEIFAEDGETAFRKMETVALNDLPVDRPLVCATGGGIVTSACNRSRMADVGTVIYLRAEWPTLQRRLVGSAGRPLLANEKDRSAAAELYARRMPDYETAGLVVDTDGQSVEDVVALIVAALEEDAL